MLDEFNREDPDAHAKLQQWRRSNTSGFIINVKGPTNAMLHRTICPHLGDCEWEAGRANWGSLGNSVKVCSLWQNELLSWAKTNVKSDLQKCKDCRP